MSVNTKMTALADEVRTLSGATDKLGIDAMTTNVQNANGEVESQATLLAQAIAALEGKTAAGSPAPVLQSKTVSPATSAQTVAPDSGYDGLSQVTVAAIPSNYEDVATETTAYTDLLPELSSVIDGLPDAGDGGSGGAVETCTVTVYGWTSSAYVAYTSPNGPIISNHLPNPFVASDVVCNSLLVCGNGASAIEPATRISGEGEFLGYVDGSRLIALFRTPTTAGTETTFENYDAD